MLSTCNEHFVHVGASDCLQFIQIRRWQYYDKLTFGDKRKPSNLLSLFLCFANLWLKSYIIIVFFIIVDIIIIIIIVVNNSLPKSSTSSFLYLLLMKLGSNISSISETLLRFQSTLNSVWIDRNMNKWKLY